MLTQTRKAAGLTREQVSYYMGHWVEFIEQQIYHLSPDEWKANKPWRRVEPESKEIIQAVQENDRVAIRSGHGISKTTCFAWLAMLWLFLYENSKVICTGPKFDQLKITLWAEIQKWLQKSNIQDEIKWTAERIYHVSSPGTWFGQIVTSKERENIAGVHADHLLVLIDEASGVDDLIFEALIGCVTGFHNRLVAAGNPTRINGFHFDAFGKDGHLWFPLHFSSEDSAIVSPAWLDKMTRKYTRENDVFRVRVLGLPPTGNPNAVFTLEEVEAAKNRPVEAGDFLEMAVDPADEGDDLAVVGIRQGNKVLAFKCIAKTTEPDLRGHVLTMLRDYRKKTGIETRVRVKIDDNGFGRALRHNLALNTTDNIEVVPCMFGGSGDDRYSNYATVMWFGLKEIIDQIELPDDEFLTEELITREWGLMEDDRIKIESKKLFKVRYHSSPDRADMLVLLFAKGPKKIFRREADSESNVRDFEIDWTIEHLMDPTYDGVLMVETLHYAALVLNDDLSISGIAAVYEYLRDRLWIYREFYQETPVPEHIAYALKRYTKPGTYEDGRDVKILGSESMFRQQYGRRPFANVLRPLGIHVIQPRHYDEFGAIGLGAQMFQANKVIFHTLVQRARSEINLWSIKRGRPDTANDGFCETFLMVLSEVRKQMRDKPKRNTMPDYKPVVEKPKPINELTAWMSR